MYDQLRRSDNYHRSIINSPYFINGNLLVVTNGETTNEYVIGEFNDILERTKNMWYVGVKIL